MKFSETGPARPWHQFEHMAFDIDGTLLNSNLAHVWAWQDAIEAEDIFFPHITLFMQMGLPGHQIVEKFSYALRDRATAERIRDRAATIFTDKYLAHIAIFDGALKVLGKLKAQGHKLHALTSSGEGEAQAMLEHFKLSRYFDVVMAAEQAGEGQPGPQPFSRLKMSIGAKAELISLGDSPYDFQASSAAGVPFVYLGHGGFPREWFMRAHTRFFNIGEMLKTLPRSLRAAA